MTSCRWLAYTCDVPYRRLRNPMLKETVCCCTTTVCTILIIHIYIQLPPACTRCFLVVVFFALHHPPFVFALSIRTFCVMCRIYTAGSPTLTADGLWSLSPRPGQPLIPSPLHTLSLPSLLSRSPSPPLTDGETLFLGRTIPSIHSPRPHTLAVLLAHQPPPSLPLSLSDRGRCAAWCSPRSTPLVVSPAALLACRIPQVPSRIFGVMVRICCR